MRKKIKIIILVTLVNAAFLFPLLSLAKGYFSQTIVISLGPSTLLMKTNESKKSHEKTTNTTEIEEVTAFSEVEPMEIVTREEVFEAEESVNNHNEELKTESSEQELAETKDSALGDDKFELSEQVDD